MDKYIVETLDLMFEEGNTSSENAQKELEISSDTESEKDFAPIKELLDSVDWEKDEEETLELLKEIN